MKRYRRSRPPVQAPSAFARLRFPPGVIVLAVRWYLRCGLSHRVRSFTPELIDAARPSRHAVGDRWFVDETRVKVNGVWRYVYWAIDQHGQIIGVFVSRHRDIASARRFFATAVATHRSPVGVLTGRAPAPAKVIAELMPAAFHNPRQYENNRCEADHGRLKSRLRPLRTGSRGRAGVPTGHRLR